MTTTPTNSSLEKPIKTPFLETLQTLLRKKQAKLEEAKQLVKKEKRVKDSKVKERKEKAELFHKLTQMSPESQEWCSRRGSYI